MSSVFVDFDHTHLKGNRLINPLISGTAQMKEFSLGPLTSAIYSGELGLMINILFVLQIGDSLF